FREWCGDGDDVARVLMAVAHDEAELVGAAGEKAADLRRGCGVVVIADGDRRTRYLNPLERERVALRVARPAAVERDRGLVGCERDVRSRVRERRGSLNVGDRHASVARAHTGAERRAGGPEA